MGRANRSSVRAMLPSVSNWLLCTGTVARSIAHEVNKHTRECSVEPHERIADRVLAYQDRRSRGDDSVTLEECELPPKVSVDSNIPLAHSDQSRPQRHFPNSL